MAIYPDFVDPSYRGVTEDSTKKESPKERRDLLSKEGLVPEFEEQGTPDAPQEEK